MANSEPDYDKLPDDPGTPPGLTIRRKSFTTPDPPRGRKKISLLDYDPKLRRRDVDYVSSDPGHVPHSRFPWKLVIAVLAFIGLCLVCAIRGGGFSISGPSAFFALSSTNYGSTVSTSNVQGNNDLDWPNDLDGSNELADGPNGDRLFGGTNTTAGQDLGGPGPVLTPYKHPITGAES